MRRLRKKQKLTQNELANACGLDRTYISMLELGQRSPTLTSCVEIAQGMNLPLRQLIDAFEEELQAAAVSHKPNN